MPRSQRLELARVRHLVLADARLPDLPTLLQRLPQDAQVCLIHPHGDALGQMAQAAGRHSQLSGLHVLGHGSPGRMLLGDQWLDARTLEQAPAAMAIVAAALADDAQVWLYGCRSAQGAAGARWLDAWAWATGATVHGTDEGWHAGNLHLGIAHDTGLSAAGANPLHTAWLDSGWTHHLAPANTHPTFNAGAGTGMALLPGGTNFTGGGLVQQADGKLVAAATQYIGTSTSVGFKLVRLLTDGQIDDGFGTSGVVGTQVSLGADFARSILVQPDGRLVVAGYSGNQPDFTVARFLADGTLDASFGQGGKRVLAVGPNSDEAYTVLQQPNGQLLVGGFSYLGGSDSDFSVVRLNADGGLDEGFGNGGRALIAVGGDYDIGRTMALQPNGQLVMAGQTGLDVSLIRLNTNGTPDNSFGTNGRSIVRLPDTADSPATVLVQADGGLLVAFNASSSLSRFGVMRLTDNGNLDTSFASGGVLIDPTLGHAINTSAILQADGKLVVAGQLVGVNESFDIFLVRLNANGSRDAGFGTDGRVILSIRPEATAPGMGATNYSDQPFQVIQQADGKLAIVGRNDLGELSIFRLNPDGSRDTTFGGFAVTTLNAEVAYTEGVAPVALDSNVRIVDAQLAALNGGNGDYSGASLTLARLGGRNTEDVLGISTSGASFTVSGNALQSAGQTFATFSQSDGSLSIRFTGSGTVPTQALVNEVLSHITYANSSSAPPATVSLAWTFSDGNTGAQGTGGALGTTGVTTVNITAVDNRAPTLGGLSGTAQAVTVGSAAMLSDFTVADADGDTLTVTLTPTNGTLGNLTDADPGTAGIQLTGSAASINSAIAGATFTAGAAGAARVDIAVSDGVAASPTTGSYTLTATAANVAPTLAGIPGTAQSVTAGTAAALADFTVADANDDTLAVTLTPTNGTLGNLTDADPGTAGIQLTGSAASINAAIAGATFTAAAEGAARIDIGVSDGIAVSPTTGTYTLTAAGVPGNTHPSFNTGVGTGQVITALGTSFDDVYSVIQQADGKLVMAGSSNVAGDYVFALVRLNADGSPDTSFDTDGRLLLPLGAGDAVAYSVIQQANGQLVVAGYTTNGSATEFAVVRLNADGSQDTGFGAGGAVFNTLGVGRSVARSVVEQADGKLVIAGEASSDFGIVRLNANGSPDNSFGTGGALRVSIGFTDEAYSVLQQTDRQLVVAGRSGDDFSLIRLNANGTVDNSFSGDGKHVISVGTGSDTAYSVIQQQDGKLVLAGIAFGGNGYDFGLVRLNTHGTPDDEFGTNGTLVVPLGAGSIDQGFSLIQQADGKLVVSGRSSDDSGRYDFGIIRLNLDGTLDTTFSADGTLLIPVGSGNDSARSVIQQADGKLVLAGAAGGSFSTDFGIVRLNPDGSLDTTFGGAARTTLGGEAAYTEGAAPVVLDGSVQIVDAQLAALNGGNGDYSGASLTLARQDGAKSEDKLDISASGASFTISGTALQSGGQTFATFSVGDGDLSIRFTGGGAAPTQALVNDVLSHITYANGSRTPPASVTLAWTFNDGNSGAQGTGGALSADGITTVTITPVDDNRAPTIGSLPGTAQAVRVGTPAALADFTVADADGDRLTVTLTPTNGTLGNLTDANPGLAGVQLVGSAAAINAAIAGATFTAGAAGAARIDIRVSDDIAASPTQGAYTLTAAAANVAPTLAGVPGSAQRVTVGTPAALADFTVADADGDALTVTLTPTNGTLGNLTDADPGVAGVQLTGSAASINAAIAGASFTAGAVGTARIDIRVSDGLAASPTTDAYTLTAVAANVPQNIIGIPGTAQSVTVGTPAALADFTVVDPDSDSLTVLLTPVNGTLGNIIDADPGVAGVQLVGSAASINAAIAGATFTASTAGAARIEVSVADFATGTTVVDHYTFTAVAANVPPTVTGIPGTAQSVTVGTPAALADFTVVDPDGDSLTVTLTPTNGTLGNLSDANPFRSGIQLTGSASSINAAIADATFTASSRGTARIDISVSDNVFTSGTTGTYTLTAAAANVAPTLAGVPGVAQIVTVGTPAALADFTVADANGDALTVTLTPTNGTLGNLTDADPGAAGLQLTGFSADIYSAIAGATFTAGAAGPARIDIRVSDGVADSPTLGTYALTAVAANFAPTIAGLPGAAQRVTVGTPAALADFTVDDANGDALTVTLTPTNGTLGNLTDVDPGVAGIQLTGSAASINAAIATAIFTATSEGAARIAIGVSDGVATPPTTGIYSLTALSTNVVPILAGIPGTAQRVTVGSPAALEDFTVYDANSDSLTVTLAPTNGTLGNLNDVDPGAAGIQLFGSAASINAAIAGATFTVQAAGPASIDIVATDGRSADVATSTYRFVSANTAPSFGGSLGTPATYSIGAPPKVLDSSVGIVDAELAALNDGRGDYSGASLVMFSDYASGAIFGISTEGASFTVSGNTLQQDGLTFATFTQAYSEARPVIDTRLLINFTGSGTVPTQALVDDVLGHITYSNSYTRTGPEQAVWLFNDGNVSDAQGFGSRLSARGVTTVDLNSAPELLGLPSTTTTAVVGTALALANFAVADADGDPLTVTLTAINGRLAPVPGTPGALIDTDPDMPGIQLTGTAASINAELAGATFVARDEGPARIDIQVTDGFAGSVTTGAYNLLASARPPQANTAPAFVQSTGAGTVIQTGLSIDHGGSLIQQADGKLVVAGYVRVHSSEYFGVRRLNGDGSLDTAFNDTAGFAINLPSTSDDRAHALIQQDTGSLVIAGSSMGDFTIVRFTPDGELDPSFDLDGMRFVSVSPGDDIAYSVIQQADGKLLLAGSSTVNGNADFSLIRLNRDGSLDYTFSVDGMLTAAIGQYDDEGRAVIQQADGKIVVAGYSAVGSGEAFSLIRLLGSGAPDTTFGDDGKVLVRVGASVDRALSVIQQTDGRLVLAGWSINGGSTDFSLIRLDPDGSLDTSFGGDGRVIVAGSTGLDEAYNVIQQADGKLVAVGRGVNGNDTDIALIRLLPDGELDRGFGLDGRVFVPVGSARDIGYSIVQQSDGKLVVAGSSEVSAGRFGTALVRLNLDGSLDRTFGPQTVTPTLGGTVAYTEGAAAIRLDSSVAIFDTQLAALGGGNGDYSGTSLTLARQGGANPLDVLGIGTSGARFSVSGNALQSGGQTFATFSTGNGGLSIRFTGSDTAPTQALLDDVLSHITYANRSNSPPPTVTLAWSFSDGNSGAQGTGGALGATGLTTVAITSIDGPTSPRVDVLPTSDTENKVPSLGIAAVEGDGNGDGIRDSVQAAVASVQFSLRDTVSPELRAGASAFVTLVSGSSEGKVTGSDSKITNVQQLESPADMPKGIAAPLGLIAFDAAIAQAGGKETFSLFADVALGVNGYWKQDASGTWVNLASEPYGGKMTEVGGKLRLDFVIEDGGQFDADGTANGVIVDPGALGTMAQSITDHPSVVPVAEHFWF